MTAAKGKEDGRKLKRFGWHGLQLTVPSNWEMVSNRGGHESGYVALADGAAVRLEMKWDVASQRGSPSEGASLYIRQLRKRAKKSGTGITVNRQLNLASLSGKETECYDWSGGTRGAAVVARCEECGRLAHIIVLGQPGQSLRGLARTVFGSFKDHPEDDLVAWKFYDVTFSSPKDMYLRRHDLKTGCIRMLFERKGRELEFVRVSLARVLVAGRGLEEWLRDFYSPELKRWRSQAQPARWRGHEGLRLEGKARLLSNPGRLVGRAKAQRIACWHCEDSNRLFIVRHNGRHTDQDEETFQQVVRHVGCCEET